MNNFLCSQIKAQFEIFVKFFEKMQKNALKPRSKRAFALFLFRLMRPPYTDMRPHHGRICSIKH